MNVLFLFADFFFLFPHLDCLCGDHLCFCFVAAHIFVKTNSQFHPTRLIVWKQLQQEAHTTHKQASDVMHSSRRPIL